MLCYLCNKRNSRIVKTTAWTSIPQAEHIKGLPARLFSAYPSQREKRCIYNPCLAQHRRSQMQVNAEEDGKGQERVKVVPSGREPWYKTSIYFQLKLGTSVGEPSLCFQIRCVLQHRTKPIIFLLQSKREREHASLSAGGESNTAADFLSEGNYNERTYYNRLLLLLPFGNSGCNFWSFKEWKKKNAFSG